MLHFISPQELNKWKCGFQVVVWIFKYRNYVANIYFAEHERFLFIFKPAAAGEI